MRVAGRCLNLARIPDIMPPPVPSVTTITLRWLLRLRWVAVGGQLAALLFAAFVLKMELPWVPLLTGQ